MSAANATPPRRDALRRSVLNFATPLRKSTAKSVTPSMEPHDEEQERSGRRSMVVMLKRLSSIPSPTVEKGHLLSEREIQDQLRICTKLYSENRISSRNAWELHIIDAIRKIVTQNQANLMQVAGSSLDVGSKIYSLRIDDAHNKGIQLASNVGKSDRKQAKAAENDNVTEENPGPKRRQGRKKVLKILADKKTIIDEEGKSLFGPIKPMESVVFATKENIEVSAIDNLLTSKVPVNPASHKFMLLSNEKYWTTKSDDVLKYQNQIIDNDLPPVASFDLCVRFKHFEIGTWSPEEEANLLEESFNSVPPPALDENGVPIPELDGSIHDIFADNDDVPMDDPASDTEQQEQFQMQLHDGINPIADAVPQEYRIETDYGYNALIRGHSGMYFDKIWAGPCHWKVKFIKKSTARYSGSSVQQVVRQVRKKNEPEPINFSEPFVDMTNTLKQFVIKRRPGTTDFEKVTYPVLDSWVDNFLKKMNFFSLKPNTPFAKPNTAGKNPDYEVPIYNYENPNDSLYCSLPETNDEPGDHSFGEDMPPVEQQQFLEGNLVDAPEIVSVNHVTYAMHAKKIDMKKLKTCIWKHLTGGQQGTVQPTKFSTVYEQIPVLAPEMSKNLSPHLGILSLLHLCNDHNLCLKPVDDRTDFIVMNAQN